VCIMGVGVQSLLVLFFPARLQSTLTLRRNKVRVLSATQLGKISTTCRPHKAIFRCLSFIRRLPGCWCC
jgi:hypothetical protein